MLWYGNTLSGTILSPSALTSLRSGFIGIWGFLPSRPTLHLLDGERLRKMQSPSRPVALDGHVQEPVGLAAGPRAHLELLAQILVELLALEVVAPRICHDDVVDPCRDDAKCLRPTP